MPNPKYQDPREVIAEVQHLGDEIEQRLSRVFELSESLYNSVRHGQFRQERERGEHDLRLVRARLERATKQGADPEVVQQLTTAARELERRQEAQADMVPAYMMFANAWKRLAGSMHQGLRRANSVNRTLQQLQEKHGVTTPEPARAAPAPTPATPTSAVDELVELYGEEALNDAQR